MCPYNSGIGNELRKEISKHKLVIQIFTIFSESKYTKRVDQLVHVQESQRREKLQIDTGRETKKDLNRKKKKKKQHYMIRFSNLAKRKSK